MSLPPATRDISNKPTAGAVTDPVNKQAKDADVDRKIQLYGAIEAFRLGRMPSNEQIDRALQYVLDHSLVDTNKLSSEGKKLSQDTRDIIETAREMVLQKNADELFQQFIWHTREVDREGMKGGVKVGAPEGVDKEKVIEDQQQAVRHLRTLLSIVLTNSEVRKLLSDFSTIGRDLLSITAQKAATLIAPDPEKLAHVNETGPKDQFVTEGGRTAGKGETPVLEARVPGTNATMKHHPRQDDDIMLRDEDGRERPVGEMAQKGKEAVQNEYQAQKSNGGPVDQGRAKDVGRGVMNRAGIDSGDARGVVGDDRVDRVKSQANGVRADATEYQEVQSEEETERKKQGLLGKMKGFRDNLTDRVPQEHKDRAERSKKFLTEEYFPEERRDQFIFRGKKVIIECQKHDDYQESLRWLLSLMEEYAQHGREMGGKGKEDVTVITKDRALQEAINEIRTILERFANGQSMDIIMDAFNALRNDAQKDEELREWFKRVDAYVRKVLLEPGYVLEPDCNTQASQLRDSGRKFYDDRYKTHFDNLFNSVGDWFKAMGDDPLNKRFGEDWARLTRDLLFDNEGSLKFKKDLWNDVRKVILPEIVNKVGYIPIPRVEYTDDSLDLVVENLTLSGRNLFPNVIALEAHNYVRFSPYSNITNKSQHSFTLTFSQMQADIRDVAFYFKKKTMPRLTDSGIADVVLGGEGLSATVSLVSAGKDRSSVFKVHDVHVKVDSLKFSIRDSKHDFLYNTLRPLATGLVKRQIQKALRDALHTGLEYADGQLVAVRDRMEAAKKEEDGEGRAEVLKNLFQRKKDEASVKSEHSVSHFKVVSSKRNSLLSTAVHPAGWVNRTAEKEEVAKKGAEWRSEAFNLPVST